MNKLIKTLLITLLVAGTACTSQAQDEDSKIKVTVTKEVDGKKQTFERGYANAAEMQADEEYHEFAGDDKDFNLYFDTDGLHEKLIELHGDGGTRAYSFSFDDDDSRPLRHLKKHEFRNGGGHNSFFYGDDNAIFDLKSFDSEEYEEELEEKMAELEEKLKGLDKNLQKDIMESMEEIEEMSSSLYSRRINRSGISIEDTEGEFGKRGNVDANSKFDIDPDFMILNSRLTLRFRVEDAGELTVKISNEDGKDIYNRYFEKFGGTFSDNIDFSNYSDGKYLLEITKDKKRLTKMVVID
ncbi:MAG: T9SS type A sorting domain-containing protein [Cytophagales bacterium]|nr:T9SS type A sorting domain-containing protein [Cytophagales bacterium]